MEDLANALAGDVWSRFSSAYAAAMARVQSLQPRVQAGTATPAELEEFFRIQGLAGGYCLAGRVADHGPCRAFKIQWGPLMPAASVDPIEAEKPIFWGVPDIIERLIFGFDSQSLADILASGKWSGTEKDLLDIVARNQLISPKLLPIREAVDWVHTVIHTTIRGTKFANWPHWCGGPVEIAVITTDRPFRWVRHKRLDAAIITAEEARP